MTWAHRDLVSLIWVAIAIVGGLAALELRGRGSLGALLSPLMQQRLVVRSSVARIVARLGLVGLALVACVVALMRPQAEGQTITVAGGRIAGDVIVLLDVSKSMLAEDAPPNRLDDAKSQITTMAQELRGHRLGLVAFAGRAVLVCPPTTDEGFFDLVLSGVDTRTVSRGGTRIGDAIRTAVKAFPDGSGAKMIVLITDGEDHESGPLDAAKDAAAAGVRIVAVGLGSKDGSPVVLTDPKTNAKTTMMHDGKPVISKLDEATLQQIAATTDGAYVPAGTSALDLPSIVKEHVQPMMLDDAQNTQRTVPIERYPWALAVAIAALVGAAALGGIGRRA